MADRRSIHLQLKVLIIPLSSPALIAFRCRPCANTEERDHSLAYTHVNEHAIKCIWSQAALWNATDVELTASFSDVITPPTFKCSHIAIIKQCKCNFYWFLRSVTNTTQSWPFHYPVHTHLSMCAGWRGAAGTWPPSHTDTHYTSSGWMRSWHSTASRKTRFHGSSDTMQC